MNTYELDTLVQLASAFTAADGVTPIDPATVTLYIRDPTGAETTVAMGSLTHAGTGIWTYQQACSISGVWLYKFQGAGNVQVTSPDTPFFVEASRLIPG